MSNGSICKWEDKNPGIENVKRVADYFGVPIDTLLTDDKKIFSQQMIGLREDERKLLALYNSLNREDEQKLLALYNCLNEEGKKRLFYYAEDLTDTGKYSQ